MKQFHLNRLLKLAAFLDALPRQKFDFSVIVTEGDKPPLDALKFPKMSCGTVACAIGWMPAVFPRYVTYENYPDISGKNRAVGVCLRASPSDSGFDAAEKFFGLSGYEASNLFSPTESGLGDDATAKQVASSIRRFVRLKQKAGIA